MWRQPDVLSLLRGAVGFYGTCFITRLVYIFARVADHIDAAASQLIQMGRANTCAGWWSGLN